MFSFIHNNRVVFNADGVNYNWTKKEIEKKLTDLANINIRASTHWIFTDLSIVKSTEKERAWWNFLSCVPKVRKHFFNPDLTKAHRVYVSLGLALLKLNDRELMVLHNFANAFFENYVIDKERRGNREEEESKESVEKSHTRMSSPSIPPQLLSESEQLDSSMYKGNIPGQIKEQSMDSNFSI